MIPTSMFEAVGDSALMVNAGRIHSGFLFLEKNDVLYLFDTPSVKKYKSI